MTDISEVREKIYSEITSVDSEITRLFITKYKKEADLFAELMAKASLDWQNLAYKVSEHEKMVYVLNIVYCSITLHVMSMKLFLSGHIVAAGNLSRQVTEAIATSLLCSGKTLGTLERFVDDKYSTSHSVRDVLRQHKALGLHKEALDALSKSEDFYHPFSHFSIVTVGSFTSFSENALYIGASFDEEKLETYDSEIRNRLGLAKVFPSFITAVATNVAKW